MVMSRIVFVDTEVSAESGKVCDFGAVNAENEKLHTRSEQEFAGFIRKDIPSGDSFICGHNILAHDLKYIDEPVDRSGIKFVIDTLYLSPLLFPNRPYHALLKDDKLCADELNNPLNDSIKAMQLFYDEVNAFSVLDDDIKDILCSLLYEREEFYGFFVYMKQKPSGNAVELIKRFFYGKICSSCDIGTIIENNPIELAYCLALITAKDIHSVIPAWVHINFPAVDNVMRLLRNTPCADGCEYCRSGLDAHKKLKSIFGYDDFRRYNDEPLQEMAVNAAVRNRSLLAVFPTGGGKSITFQLPALMAGEASRGLTVVISPLQSLMKDQVDNLEKKGIADAVAINGLMSCIERAEAFERVENGLASIIYISPESLRSRTIERLLLSRNIARFVIDEAHCFSAWGQDFRVDYLYIGDFIRELQEKKNLKGFIPVSCFTATAKQKVISDIREYFKNKLDLDLELFATSAARSNLRYEVLYKETDEEKYTALRDLIEQKNCPAIVYVSRTKRTYMLADKLREDGYKALPFNGKMESTEKQANQEAFIKDDVQIIVATSAFGMGVDKPNVGLVVHFDISDSLENYVQEAGRAGRDQSLTAECCVLFNDGDLDKHFLLLNQTKLSISEIQQVWKAIKDLTKTRSVLCRSPLEIARQAGWDDTAENIETRVKTAVLALENAGYIKRGKNVPRYFADGIIVPDMQTASVMIDRSDKFSGGYKISAKRIMSSLISKKNISRAGNAEAGSKIDYLSDRLGIPKADVIRIINLLREEGMLADSKDMDAFIRRSESRNRSLAILNKFTELENFLIGSLDEEGSVFFLKELNEKAQNCGIKGATVANIKTVFYYWTIRNYIQKNTDAALSRVHIIPKIGIEAFRKKRNACVDISGFIVSYLFDRYSSDKSEKEEILVQYSIMELKNAYEQSRAVKITDQDIEEALLYLSKIDAMKLDGNFLVIYNSMEITRLELDNKIKYKKDDYKQLNDFYCQKIQQIHIVGEYANMMVRDYNAALQFVNDYFQLDYKKFLGKYFEGERLNEIERTVTPDKYKKLFYDLSEKQREIINDKSSQYIVVTAGPGSGKTRLLVHKLASLLMLEDVKHEQLLMVTFSRAAVTEFKKRLYELIGNAASFVEIKTFHSYCFDLLGKVGNLDKAENIVSDAARMIKDGEVELGRITKTVVVIDEAQDMDSSEYALIEALMERNEDMRVIAVGDDDQNIYGFRGSDSKYLRLFITEKNAVKYELTENYRSCRAVVSLANAFAKTITDRMKVNPIVSMSDQSGEVKIIRYRSRNIETAVVNDLMSSYDGSGSVCVLTSTNIEALRVMGMLVRSGQRAKLIQSNDGFDIYNLAEIRFFMKVLERGLASPIISPELWNEAKGALESAYSRSSALPMCISLLDDYANSCERKYKSDLDAFIHESKLEDFYHAENGIVFVSTIHKSKGREFDDVYMMLDNVCVDNDEERRKIYVGLTRAKNRLHIHCSNNIFDDLDTQGAERITDERQYPMPDEMILQLSHSDVFLGFFKDKKNLILRLRSGMKLLVTANGMSIVTRVGNREILRFSRSFKAQLADLAGRGYVPYKGEIRFIIAWTDKNDNAECAVVLPDIYLRK